MEKLENILKGEDKYWKINDRFSALSDYLQDHNLKGEERRKVRKLLTKNYNKLDQLQIKDTTTYKNLTTELHNHNLSAHNTFSDQSNIITKGLDGNYHLANRFMNLNNYVEKNKKTLSTEELEDLLNYTEDHMKTYESRLARGTAHNNKGELANMKRTARNLRHQLEAHYNPTSFKLQFREKLHEAKEHMQQSIKKGARRAAVYTIPAILGLTTALGGKLDAKTEFAKKEREQLNRPGIAFYVAQQNTLQPPPTVKISDYQPPQAKVLTIVNGKFVPTPYHDNNFINSYKHATKQIKEVTQLIPDIAELLARRDINDASKGYRHNKKNLEATFAGLTRQESICTQSYITPKGDTLLVQSPLGYTGVSQLGINAIIDVINSYPKKTILNDSLFTYLAFEELNKQHDNPLINTMLKNKPEKAFDKDIEGLRDNVIKGFHYFTMKLKTFKNENLAHTAYNGSHQRAKKISNLLKPKHKNNITYDLIKDHLMLETQRHIPRIENYKASYKKNKEGFITEAMGSALNKYVVIPAREAFNNATDKKQIAEQLSTFHEYLSNNDEAKALASSHYVGSTIASNMMTLGLYFQLAGDVERAANEFEHVTALLPKTHYMARRATNMLNYLPKSEKVQEQEQYCVFGPEL